MASQKRRSSTPELPRISALTARLEAQHMKSVNHRLFYIAKINPERTDYREITDHYERLFLQMLKHNLGEAISGLLLLYPSCIVHIIESSSEILYGVIQDLAAIQNLGVNSLLQDARILVISHNIPSRLFPQWYFRLVRLSVQYLHDSVQGQSEEKVLEEFLTTMLKLGVFLSKILESGSKGPGKNLHDLAPEFLLQEGLVLSLTKSDKLLKPLEFLESYNRPVEVPSDSGGQYLEQGKYRKGPPQPSHAL
ncbi:testis-expressed protein 47-like [Gastrophryne carolinensis]